MATIDVGATSAPAMTKHELAEKRIEYYARWAAATGAIPAPILDLAALTAVQLKMLKTLAKIYGIEFKETYGKAVLGSVLGALVPTKLAFGGLGMAIKSIPGIGTIAGMAAVPGFNYASTHAVGKVFEKHFASGGKMLSLDPKMVEKQVADVLASPAPAAK